MIDVQILGDWRNKQFVRGTMRCRYQRRGHSILPIPDDRVCADPDPAPAIRLWNALAPETVRQARIAEINDWPSH